MKKLLSLICCLLLLTTVLSGCDYGSVEKETELDYIPEGDSLTQFHEIEGIKIRSQYDTGRYEVAKWRITDNKVVNMSLEVISDLPEGVEIFVEHVHADINVKTTRERTNGFLQDSFDDSYHGDQQPGFCISEGYEYHEIFSIEGYNDSFISGYSNAYWGSVTESRVTESQMRERGAYAQQLNVVYDLCIRYPGEKYFHTVAILDEILIPLAKEMK